MNKLQLYINKSLKGYKSVRNINPAENVQRHVHEVRDALALLEYDPAEKNLFYLLSYIDEGSLFTILRTIPDKPLDHLATTIFIPNGLIITAEQMTEIVRRTTRMVSNPAVSADEVNDLYEVFSREYPTEPSPAMMVASQGHEYACCYYGGNTGHRLEDFYGPEAYQPQYLPFAGLLLVDADLGVETTAADVTDEPTAQIVTLLPPDERPEGFVPHIYHHLFDRPARVPLGHKVDIVWRRGGFEDSVQTVEISADGQKVEPVSNADNRKNISPASFMITSQATKGAVRNAVITVNGVEISEARTFTHDELKDADVIIRAPGYFPFHTRLDLAATTQALIQLQETRKIYRFELPVKSAEIGAPIHFEIHTKREITDSPIEGYVLLDAMREGAARSNHLQYVGGGSAIGWRTLALSALGALLVGFLLGWLLMAPRDAAAEAEPQTVEETVAQTKAPDKQKETSKQAQPKATVPTAQAPAAPATANTAVASAVAYLDRNPKWTREEMEKIPELQGLFDDMNNFRLERLAGHWGTKLGASKAFVRVAHHATESLRKKKFKPQGQYNNRADDTTIALQNYLNKIDP